jgi:hypothetical protein
MLTKLVENPELKKPVGKYKGRWEDNIQLVTEEQGVKVWTGFIRRVYSSGWLWCRTIVE